MALPIILGAAAAAAGLTGVGSGIYGAIKMKGANDTMKQAQSKHERNLNRLEQKQKETNDNMDNLGSLELKALKDFSEFSDTIEKIQGRPEFKTIQKGDVSIPQYDKEEFKKVSVGAGLLFSGLAGVASGVAGGFAAAGATTSAVMALGTASTGTAISTLSGAALTNATLAALGGGALAAGGGGMALGTAILGATTFGFGILVGGILFNVAGKSLSDKADEAFSQANQAEIEINKIIRYLEELILTAKNYRDAIECVKKAYDTHYNMLSYIVNISNKTEWCLFSDEQKLITENTVLLAGILYNMCKVQLVLSSGNSEEPNKVNMKEINQAISCAKIALDDIGIKNNISEISPKKGTAEANGEMDSFDKLDNLFDLDKKDVKGRNRADNQATIFTNAAEYKIYITDTRAKEEGFALKVSLADQGPKNSNTIHIRGRVANGPIALGDKFAVVHSDKTGIVMQIGAYGKLYEKKEVGEISDFLVKIDLRPEELQGEVLFQIE